MGSQYIVFGDALFMFVVVCNLLCATTIWNVPCVTTVDLLNQNVPNIGTATLAKYYRFLVRIGTLFVPRYRLNPLLPNFVGYFLAKKSHSLSLALDTCKQTGKTIEFLPFWVGCYSNYVVRTNGASFWQSYAHRYSQDFDNSWTGG